MKRTYKNLLFSFLTLIILLCSIACSNNKDNNLKYSEKEINEFKANFEYEGLIEEENVTITKYIGNDIEVVIPEFVVGIRSYAFFNCTYLKKVYYKGSIEQWCNLEMGVESNPMGHAEHFYMLNNKNKWYEVTSIEIPNTITKIGNYQFFGFDNLINVTIPDSVTSIGISSFDYCFCLQYKEFKNGLYLGNKENPYLYLAFVKDKTIDKYILKDNTRFIGDRAFSNYSSLTSITIPSSVISFGSFAFSECNNLENVYYEGTIEEWCRIKFSDYASNPMSKANLFYIFDDNNNLHEVTNIEIPNTITKIEKFQFSGFDNLNNILIPKSVTSIGNSAFEGCRSLSSITIPDSVTSIGDLAFYECISLTSIEIPDSVTSIGDFAFYGCSSLTSIDIPNNVTSIENYTFYGCSGLTNVTIPNSVASIGDYAFYHCLSLENVYYKGTIEDWNSIEFIGDGSNPMKYADNFFILDSDNEWVDVIDQVKK